MGSGRRRCAQAGLSIPFVQVSAAAVAPWAALAMAPQRPLLGFGEFQRGELIMTNTNVMAFKLCPSVADGCDHGSVVNSDGVIIGCRDYDGPELLWWNAEYANGVSGHVIRTKVMSGGADNMPCSWCEDVVPAALRVNVNGWEDGVCIAHALRFWPDCLGKRRPVEFATVFRMKIVAAGPVCTLAEGEWVNFPSFADLFKASRSMSRGGRWREVSSSSNAHYRRTGHHRMTWQAESLPGASVVVHVIVR